MILRQGSLEGKIALITDGASGIGESIVRLFRRHGAKVYIADLQDELGHSVCESLGGESYGCFIHCDVAVEDDVHNAVDFTATKFGTIDVMVNNAGITGNKVTDIRDVDFNEFKKVHDVYVNGTFIGMKHAARLMIPRGKGSIISRPVYLKGVDVMPEDVAEAVLFLASDVAKYISALNLVVDGGFTSVNHSLKAIE